MIELPGRLVQRRADAISLWANELLVAKENLEYRGRLAAISSKPEFRPAGTNGQEIIESGIDAAPECGITSRANSVRGDRAADGKRENVLPTRWTFLRAKDAPHRLTPCRDIE